MNASNQRVWQKLCLVMQAYILNIHQQLLDIWTKQHNHSLADKECSTDSVKSTFDCRSFAPTYVTVGKQQKFQSCRNIFDRLLWRRRLKGFHALHDYSGKIGSKTIECDVLPGDVRQVKHDSLQTQYERHPLVIGYKKRKLTKQTEYFTSSRLAASVYPNLRFLQV